MAADNELSRGHLSAAQAHLDACPICCRRLGEIEALLEDVNHLQHSSVDSQIPDATNARARLQVRLRGMAEGDHPAGSAAPIYAPATPRGLAYVGLALLIAVVALTVMHGRSRVASNAPALAWVPAPIPERKLTPGVAGPVTYQEICRLPGRGNNADVPPALRRAVFQEYGITNARPEDYEVDYLISPALGGTASIGNLWPEPYATVWNAHVKDALENRLHELVCDGHLPLATAQHDIATDWIAAYKRYFGSDHPPSSGDDIKDPRPNPNS